MMWPSKEQQYEILYQYYCDWFASCMDKQASIHDLGQHLFEQLPEKTVRQILDDWRENQKENE